MQRHRQVELFIDCFRFCQMFNLFVGSLRWREPQLPQTTPGIQQANAFPNMCFQAGDGGQAAASFPLQSSGQQASQEKRATPVVSEDCLFLKYVFIIRCLPVINDG